MEETTECVFCKGTAELRFEDLKLFDGKIIVKAQPYYACRKCKEEYVTDEQMRRTEKELRTPFAFKKPVIETGRSLAITIPTDLAEFYNIKKGSLVQLIPEDRRTIRLKLGD